MYDKDSIVTQFKFFPSFGIIATIKYPKEVFPQLGDIISFDGKLFKIVGINVTSNDNQSDDPFFRFFDCKLTEQ